MTARSFRAHIFDLPESFDVKKDSLSLVNRTYSHILNLFFENKVSNQEEAEFCLLPINLIDWQFDNLDPWIQISNLEFPENKPTFVVALGDFSNRTITNRNGNAYRKTYPWLDKVHLLALESSQDLLPDKDIGIIPINTLEEEPLTPLSDRPIKASFLGSLSHPHLPWNHIRRRMKRRFGKCYKSSNGIWVLENLTEAENGILKASEEESDSYRALASKSVFTLCPAGYGSWTYRFFNSIKWGSIPILLSDKYIPPFSTYIPYETFILHIKESKLNRIEEIITSLDSRTIINMQQALLENQWRFTPEYFDTLLVEEMRQIAKKRGT